MAKPILDSITLNVLSSTPTRKKNTVFIKIPGKTGTVKQKFGMNSRQWQLAGVFSGSSKISDRDSIQSSHDDDDTVTYIDEDSNSFSVKIISYIAPPSAFGTRINFNMLLEEV